MTDTALKAIDWLIAYYEARTASSAREITIKLERREDGGLRVCSDQVPGLILCGPDPAQIMADILPALKALGVWPS